MASRMRVAEAVAAVALFCTGCTNGSWLDQTRLSFYTGGMDTALAGEDRTNSSLTGMVSRGAESVAVLSIETPGLDGSRAAYSPDNGASWRPVLFDGQPDPGMGLFNLSAVREGQWLLLGQRNAEVFAFTSGNGFEFSLQPGAVFGGKGLSLNAVVGTATGWLMATSPDDPSAGTAIALYLSKDGSSWTRRDGAAAGLPPAHGTFHPLSMAGSPSAVLLVGQQKNQDRPPASQAFASTDGGNSWQEASPDTSGVGPAGNALWTAAWSGREFRVTGHGWPRDVQPKQYPLGISGSWMPGGGWQLVEDPAWSSQGHEFPRQPKVAYGPAGGIAAQMIGQLADGQPRILLQPPGQPWSPLQMPDPANGSLRLYSAVAPVADGFLVAGTDSRHGNDQVRLWHVGANGTVSERSGALEAGAPLKPGSKGPHITGFSSDRKARAFGTVGSQPAVWELDGERNFRNYTTLVSEENQTLDTLADGPGGEMLLGSTRTANSRLPVIWSRARGGAWSVSSRNIFGAGTEHGGSPVAAVLPSSHGFIAAGRFHSEGADHAGLAVSEDGEDWDHIQGNGLQGTPSSGRSITSLAETPAGTVLAGGSVGEGQMSSGAVWTSPDARNWKAVLLPGAEGYTDARVVSLAAGTLRTIALVEHSTAGKPDRYSSFSSADNGLTWEHGTDLEAPSPDQDVSTPLVTVYGDGFFLAATQGRPGHHVPLVMRSGDGRQFASVPANHDALNQEGLVLSAIGVAGGKLLVAGTAGPGNKRDAFGIALDVSAP
jgi:hypothetical protein